MREVILLIGRPGFFAGRTTGVGLASAIRVSRLGISSCFVLIFGLFWFLVSVITYTGLDFLGGALKMRLSTNYALAAFIWDRHLILWASFDGQLERLGKCCAEDAEDAEKILWLK